MTSEAENMAESYATLKLQIVGDLLPVVRAFGIMSAALAAYGHEFTPDELATLAAAAEALTDSTLALAEKPEPTV